MDAKDWYECGAKIGELVQSAIDSNDFQELSEMISSSLKEGLGNVAQNAGRSFQQGMSGTYRSAGNAYQQAKERASGSRMSGGVSASVASRSLVKTKTNYKGIFSIIVGYVMAGLNSLLALAMLATFGNGFELLDVILLLVFLGAVVGFGRLAFKWTKYRRNLKKLAQYLRIIGERDVVTIEELAYGTGETKDEVIENLRQMLRDGMFAGNAYLDENCTTLMFGSESYKQYQEAMRGFKQRKAEEEMQSMAAEKSRMAADISRMQDAKRNSAAKTPEEIRRAAEKDLASYSEETRNILREGRAFIAHIHECNDRIPGEEITEKLNKLEMTVTRIFDQVAKNPDSAPDMHRLMSYYLPVTQKLIDAYVELQDQNISGENISGTREEIEKSLDTINEAFETFLDGFFEGTAWDISSDISAMKTMMARDGLTGRDDFAGVKSVSSDLKAGTGNGSHAVSMGGAQALVFGEEEE